jgi:glycyl-tRNA synthetase beta chain
MADLLFELLTEELPARFVIPCGEELKKHFVDLCAANNLTHGDVKLFGTPRRLAIYVTGIPKETPDVMKEVQGPSVKAAFDDKGIPKVPAIKFAESVKLKVEELQKVTTSKGEYLSAKVLEKGKRAIEVLPEILNQVVKKISFPKSMRWGDVEQSFGRPLHSILALLDSDVIPVVFSDVKSSNTTVGHRFLSPGTIALSTPSQYESALEKANVIVDLEKRKKMLVDRVSAVAKAAGATVLEDEELVNQVVNLVEIPNPVVGTFDAKHLDLPAEVLIQEMKSHQRYFSLQDSSGKLVPKFIAVSNTPVKDVALSVRGYERVLRARLTDGRFFFDEDRKNPLASRVEKLKKRTWVAGLGSVFDKQERLGNILSQLTIGNRALYDLALEASKLCKCDLETGMVGEFPELQGVMGREYALHDGHSKEIANAIFDHYLPRGASDSLPTGDAGSMLGIADRIDSLVCLFSIGKKPTGAKDDFAQRRAAITLIRIILGRGYRLNVRSLFSEALKTAPLPANFKPKAGDAPVVDQLLEFIRGRLESIWKENHRPDVVDAILSNGFDDLVVTHKKLEALSAQVSRPEFSTLSVTFKRVQNIVEKQAKEISVAPISTALLTEEPEKQLFAQLSKVSDEVKTAVKGDDYSKALSLLIPLKGFVDAFFDKVMVMAEDKAVKENRVRMLMEIGALFGLVADFTKLQSEGTISITIGGLGVAIR